MSDKTIRIFDHEITRRDAIKAGGVAGLGLAFSKPLIDTLRPRAAFGQASYNPCADVDPPEFTETSNAQQFTCTVVDSESGLASIDVASVDNATITIPAFTPCTNDPVDVMVQVINIFVDASWELVATDCCGNQATKFGAYRE